MQYMRSVNFGNGIWTLKDVRSNERWCGKMGNGSGKARPIVADVEAKPVAKRPILRLPAKPAALDHERLLEAYVAELIAEEVLRCR